MYKVQNLTNSALEFQGVTISAYGTASFIAVHDYVKLSQYLNSGKVRYYTSTDKPVAKTAPVVKKQEDIKSEVKEVKPVAVEETTEDTKIEDTIVELTKTPSEVPEILSVEDSVKEDTEIKNTKGRKKSSKK